MITALCLNPSFDRTVTVHEFRLGETNRVLEARTDAGGKGLNVAAALTSLSVDALCLGLAGDQQMERLRGMTDELGVPCYWKPIPGEIRTNTKLRDDVSGEVTEITEAGPTVSPETAERFFAANESYLRISDFVVLTGSVPPGCTTALYADWMRRLPKVRCVLDASGDTLALGLAEKPFLVKPNIEELAACCGLPREKWNDHSAIAEAGRSLLKRGTEMALVSMGKCGAMLITADQLWFAPALEVEAISAVGAGDAMLAGFLAGYEENHDPLEAFRWSVAAATASVLTEGTLPLRREDFDSLLPQVKVRELA